MNFGEAVKTCFRKYFDFSGRAMRSEYWWFYLFTILGSIVLSIVDLLVFGAEAADSFSPLSSLFSLAVLLPTLAVAARRLHDTNRSGWWQLMPIAPLLLLLLAIPGLVNGGSMFSVGILILAVLAMLGLGILLIVWLATRGVEGPNRFGDDPMGETLADTFS